MKRFLNVLLVACAMLSATAFVSAEDTVTQDERMGWWREARFGMFIHWGLYSILGGEWEGVDKGQEMGGGSAEWIMFTANIKKEEYAKLAPQFNPVHFNAKEWVSVAKNAGMKYIVITSKHHDGFCLFDSQYTDYTVMKASPFKRDIIKEMAEECDRQGIRFGVYYSQHQDWYHSDRSWPKHVRPSDEYLKLARGQVRELLTNYGEMDIFWFDLGGKFPEINDGYGKIVRTLQPKTVICSRLYNRKEVEKKDMTYADFESLPDREVAAKRIEVDAESCMTMRHNWGYDRDDDNWKSVKDIIERLSLSACRGANFLLNVGPKPEGLLCPEEIERLKGIGAWTKVNGEAIYGTTASPFDFDFEWGTVSQKKKTLYLHVMKWNPKGIVFNGLVSKPARAYLLADPKCEELAVKQDANGHITTIKVPDQAPDPNISVIVLEFNEPVEIDEDAKGAYHWSKTSGLKHGKRKKK